MSLIPVVVQWTVTGDGGTGSVVSGTGTFFDTDTKLITETSDSYRQGILSPKPADVHRQVGDALYWECAADFTATIWVYDGGMATHTTTEVNSEMYCGWTPPLTCDLGTVSLTQTPTATGAAVLVRFTGRANGQAWYSLDGAAEVSSPYFPDVLAGDHTLDMRDDSLAGCTRHVEFTIALATPGLVPPPEPPVGPAVGVDFVGQPLWFSPTGLPAGALVELELYAESAHGRGDFALVFRMRKQTDMLGFVSFRLDTLLWPLLRAFVPPVRSAVTQRCTTNLVDYFVRTITRVAGQPTAIVGERRTALRGGLPAEWQGRAYFADRLRQPKPCFLSWQPLGPGTSAGGQAKAFAPGQAEWLSWLCPLAVADAQLQVRRSYDQGGAVVVSDVELLSRPAQGWGNALLAIPLQLTRVGYAFVTVQLETTAGAVLSPPARYRFEEAGSRTRFLLFTNSLGGLDTLRCEGRLDVSLEAAVEQVERPAQLGGRAPAADRQVSSLTASRKLKLATGWLLPEELAWLQELVLTREVWQLAAGQLRPLDWSKRSLVPYSDEPGLRGLLLDCDYAYAPTAYAPGTY